MNAAVFELVTVRSAAVIAAVQRDRAAADGRGVVGAGDRIDLRQQRLNAVGDIELVAGRTRCHEGDRRAVDGDGVASREARGQRIRWSAAGQQRRAGDRRRRRGLVVDRASRDRCRRIEEIVRRRDGRCRHQRGVAQRLDRGRQCRLQIRRRRRGVGVSIRNEPDGGGFVVVAVSSIDSVVPSGRVKLNLILSPSFGLTAPRSMVAAGGVPVGCVTVAPVSEDCTDSSFSPNDEPSSATLVTVVVRRWRRHGEAPHVADALIRLPALVDQLREAGLRRGAVEHDVGGDGRRRIGGAAGKQIAVAGLAVEQRDRVCERRLRRDLAGGLAVVVEHEGRRGRGFLDLRADVGKSLQRQIGDVEPRVDVVRGVRKRIDGVDLRAQAEREAAIGALPGIGRRDFAARKLRRQIIELRPHIDDGRPDIGCLAANAIDRHRNPHMAWISVSYICLMDDITRALAE